MKIKWKCTLCNSVQVSDSTVRHQMDWCECGKTAVDLEEYYMRRVGNNYEELEKIED